MGTSPRPTPTNAAPMPGDVRNQPRPAGPTCSTSAANTGNNAVAPPNSTANRSSEIAPSTGRRERTKRKPDSSASAAKERLQIVLAHERIGRTREDFLPKLQQELVAVVARYVAIDASKVNVNLDRGGDMSTLAIEIELPAPTAIRVAAAAR